MRVVPKYFSAKYIPPDKLKEDIEEELEILKERSPIKEKFSYNKKDFISLLAKRSGFSVEDVNIFIAVFERVIVEILLKESKIILPSLFTIQIKEMKERIIPSGPSKGVYEGVKLVQIKFSDYIRATVLNFFGKHNLQESEDTNDEEE